MKKFRKSLQENRVDWKARNDKVLERLLSRVINNNIPTAVTPHSGGRIFVVPPPIVCNGWISIVESYPAIAEIGLYRYKPTVFLVD